MFRRYFLIFAILVLAGCRQTTNPPSEIVLPSPPPLPPPPPSYYMNVYACETVPNLARNSHLFATFIKKEGSKSEVHTISWYPADKRVRVIKSKGQKGINLTLEQTLERAKSYNAKVFKSDSYQIKQELYDKALKQIEKLENGTIKYQALSSGENVCNCIHVVANLAGPLDTGWNWGIPARDMIIKHFDKYIIK